MNTEITGNTAMYNGSVRLFWGAPNFGYFNFSGITKPTPEEYMKSVFINKSQQDNFTIDTTYTSIEEIFGVFKKEILDSFEQEFLKFSKSRYDVNPKSDGNFNFHNMMRDMLLVESPYGSSYEEIISDAQNKQIGKIDWNQLFQGVVSQAPSIVSSARRGSGGGYTPSGFPTSTGTPYTQPQQPVEKGISTNTILLIGGAAVVAYLLFKRK